MVLVKKMVILSRKVTFFFCVHISFPSTYDIFSFPSSFSQVVTEPQIPVPSTLLLGLGPEDIL